MTARKNPTTTPVVAKKKPSITAAHKADIAAIQQVLKDQGLSTVRGVDLDVYED